MTSVRKVLHSLGWPVARMSDPQIVQELYRRWFAAQPADADEDDQPISVASAKGIVIHMTREGNLDALCWSPEDRIPAEQVEPQEDEALFSRSDSAVADPPVHERRRSPRRSAKDVVRWRATRGESTSASGWLVDRSGGGIAFIASAGEAPGIGDEITPSILSRNHGLLDLGPATVVRVDPLNTELSLVCAQLEQPVWNHSI